MFKDFLKFILLFPIDRVREWHRVINTESHSHDKESEERDRRLGGSSRYEGGGAYMIREIIHL